MVSIKVHEPRRFRSGGGHCVRRAVYLGVVFEMRARGTALKGVGGRHFVYYPRTRKEGNKWLGEGNKGRLCSKWRGEGSALL